MPEDIILQMPSFLMPPPTIWNRERVPEAAMWGMDRTIKQIMFARREVRLRVLRDVFVAAEGLVIHRDLQVEPCSVRQHSETDLLVARAEVMHCQESGQIPRYTGGDVVLCRRPGAQNYGHFLLEMLPMAYVAAQHWPHPARFLTQAVEGGLGAVMREALGRLGIPPGQHITAGRSPVFIERLVLVEGLTDHGSYIAPLAIECLDRIAAAIPPASASRIFVSRGAAPTRRLVDEAEILQRAHALGYAGVLPGTLGFAAQVAAFKGATRIVGVMGATMTNVVFAPSGAEIFMLSPQAMPDTFFWFICGLRGLRLVDIRCISGASVSDVAWDGEVTLDSADEAALFACSAPPALPALFDAAFYGAVPDGGDGLEHYCRVGWREGRDPSAQFSTQGYLAAYADVASAGMNPLLHFIEHGRAEGRHGRPQDAACM